MSWYTPLGFLGLLGLAVLILIYLLKPNYQNQAVSSTFIWKLSLKYRKRKNPISKLRNLLILLCQILIITSCAFVLAQPVLADEKNVISNEKIIIIDASANMMASVDNETRFERAVRGAKEYVDSVLIDGGTVTVVLAQAKYYCMFYRVNSESAESNEIDVKLDDLISGEQTACTFGNGDIDGAMDFAEGITRDNPLAEVYLYTGTTYLDNGNVTVIDVSEDNEWNVAVLNGYSEFSDGYYGFYADVVSYGRDVRVTVTCEVSGINADADPDKPNADGIKSVYSQEVRLSGNRVETLVFNPSDIDGAAGIYSYKSAKIGIEINDSFLYDNDFYIYGGSRDRINLQYATTERNPFFRSIVLGMRDAYLDTWDIRVSEVNDNKKPELEGFDMYIFEHSMPETLPKDGVVFLMGMVNAPSELDIAMGDTIKINNPSKDKLFWLTRGDNHPIMQFVNSTQIGVSAYTRILDWDPDRYTPLMFCEGDPVILVENSSEIKRIVCTFDIHNSTLSMLDFPGLLYGIYEYFIPTTTDSFVYDVNQEITVNARGNDLTVSSANGDVSVIHEVPSVITPEVSGIYTFTQTLLSGRQVIDTVFVKIPQEQSNLIREIEVLNGPVKIDITEMELIWDIIFYILGFAVLLIFAEWWLNSRIGV